MSIAGIRGLARARAGFLAGLLGSALVAACGGGGGGGGGSSDAFFISSNSVTFNASQGGPVPAPQVVNVSVASGSVFIATSHTGSMFSQSFATTGATTGQITITPGGTATAGSFSGAITVNGCSNATGPCNHVAGSPKTINVSYNIAGLSSTPAQLDFSATTGTNPPSKTSTLAIVGGSTTWVSSTSYSPSGTNWLSLSPANGGLNPSTPSQTVTFAVNTAGLAAGVYNATATFTGGGSLTASVSVILSVGEPGVNFVAPYVVPAGVAGGVIIRGRGFSALAPATLSVQFNTTPATASIVSDTEIQAALPALSAGTYSISVSDGGAPLPSRAALKLLVINPPAFAMATVPRASPSPFAPSNLIYDAERQALLLVDRQNNRIERYAHSGGSWGPAVPATIGPGGGNPSIALSPDGTELLKTAADSLLYRLNPATLGLLSTVDAAPFLGSGSLNMIAFANDGGAVGNSSLASNTRLYRYDMLTQGFTALSAEFHMQNRLIVASGDGDTLVLPSVDPASSDQRVYTYDASGGTLTARSATADSFNRPAVNRNGSRIILVNDSATATGTVYDGSFNVLGMLPSGTNGGFALSPDGSFAYAYYPASGRVRKFDLTAPSGGSFTEVGTGVVVAAVGADMGEMTISPDGGTLFLAGTSNVVILPAP